MVAYQESFFARPERIVSWHNLDDYVGVKFTPEGEEVVKRYLNGTSPERDEHGYSYLPLWVLATMFNGRLGLDTCFNSRLVEPEFCFAEHRTSADDAS